MHRLAPALGLRAAPDKSEPGDSPEGRAGRCEQLFRGSAPGLGLWTPSPLSLWLSHALYPQASPLVLGSQLHS